MVNRKPPSLDDVMERLDIATFMLNEDTGEYAVLDEDRQVVHLGKADEEALRVAFLESGMLDKTQVLTFSGKLAVIRPPRLTSH